MKTYKDIYQLPVHVSKHGSHIWDKKGHMVAQFEYRFVNGNFEPEFKKLADNIIEVINSKDKKLEGNHVFRREEIYIYVDDDPKPVITIRGWGGLTGVGGYKLSGEEAVHIQETFGDFILNKLNQ